MWELEEFSSGIRIQGTQNVDSGVVDSGTGIVLTEAQGFCTNATPYGAARRWTVPPRLFFSFVGGSPLYQSGPPQTVRAGLICSTWVGLDGKDFQDWTSRLDFWTS